MFVAPLPLLLSMLSPQELPPYEQETVTIDDAQQFQTWRGFGASSAYVETLPDELNGNDPDIVRDLAHLQTGARRLRLRVPHEMEPNNDDNNPSNINYAGLDFSSGPTSWYPEQRTAYLEAKARGVDFVWASCGSPPAWMKINPPSNGTLINGGQLNPAMYDEFAEFLVAYVEGLAHPHTTGISDAIEIDAISILNEPDYIPNEFKSEATPTSKEEYAKLVRIVGQKFAAHGLTTQIIGPDCSNVVKTTEYLQAILDQNHPTPAIDHLDAVVAHQYGGLPVSGPVPWAQLEAKAVLAGKPFGQTEISNIIWPTDDSILAGLGDINGAGVSDWILAATNGSNCTEWSYFGNWWNDNPLNPVGTGEGLIRIHRVNKTYVVPKRFRVFQHYAAHIQPDAVRISGIASRDTGVSAWLRPVGGRKEYTIVLSNKTSNNNVVVLDLPSAPTGTMTSYLTTATQDHVATAVAATTAKFDVTLPPESIKTLIVPMGVPGDVGVEVQMTPGVLTAGDTFDLKLRYHAPASSPPSVAVILARLDPDGQLNYFNGTSWVTTPSAYKYMIPLADGVDTIFTAQPAAFFDEGRSTIYAALLDASNPTQFVGEPSWMDVIADL